jgi:hypothetical protein
VDINDHITTKQRLTGQAPTIAKPLFICIAGLNSGHISKAVSTRGDAMFGKLTTANRNLTTPTQGAPTANRVDVNTEGTRCL